MSSTIPAEDYGEVSALRFQTRSAVWCVEEVAFADNGAEAEVNAGLVEMIKEAFAIRNQLLSGSHDSIEAMSGRLGMNKGRLTSLVRLSYLGPEIVRAPLAGSQSNALTPSRLLRLSKNLPHDWKEQRCFLCFAAHRGQRFAAVARSPEDSRPRNRLAPAGSRRDRSDAPVHHPKLHAELHIDMKGLGGQLLRKRSYFLIRWRWQNRLSKQKGPTGPS